MTARQPSATPNEVLRLQGLCAGYGETVVIEDINLCLAERDSVAVLGRNGVGKTTLLASIMGHTTRHGGSVAFHGKNIDALPVYERNRAGIGYVPQTREIFPSLTVEENLTVAARSKVVDQPARWTLERVYDFFPRLKERDRHMGNQISGGEQQMLAIGRALMGNPTLLLMDEPLEGLAPRLALSVTQTALVLNRGRIVHAGDSNSLLADPDKLAELVAVH